jgi:hypothetical protein
MGRAPKTTARGTCAFSRTVSYFSNAQYTLISFTEALRDSPLLPFPRKQRASRRPGSGPGKLFSRLGSRGSGKGGGKAAAPGADDVTEKKASPEVLGDVERIVEQLLSVKSMRPGTEVCLAEQDIMWLCRRCREVRGCSPGAPLGP